VAGEIAADDFRHHAFSIPVETTMSGAILARCATRRLEIVKAHAGLERAEILHVEAEDAGQLGQIIDVAAGFDHRQHVAVRHRLALFGRQRELAAIAVLVGAERLAVGSVVDE
jgi:hypothetical protein